MDVCDIFLDFCQYYKCIDKPDFLGHWPHDSKIISSYILEVLLRLTWYHRNTPNYRQNDGFVESRSRIQLMLKVYWWRFLSIFDTSLQTRKLQALIFWQAIKFYIYFIWVDVVLKERPKLSRKWWILRNWPKL